MLSDLILMLTPPLSSSPNSDPDGFCHQFSRTTSMQETAATDVSSYYSIHCIQQLLAFLPIHALSSCPLLSLVSHLAVTIYPQVLLLLLVNLIIRHIRKAFNQSPPSKSESRKEKKRQSFAREWLYNAKSIHRLYSTHTIHAVYLRYPICVTVLLSYSSLQLFRVSSSSFLFPCAVKFRPPTWI